LKYIKMKAQYIKFKLAEESDLKYSKRVIVMSHFVKEGMRKFYGKRHLENVRIYPIGVNMDQYKPQKEKSRLHGSLDLDLNKIVFFTLRRLEPRMGLENLLYAIKDVVEKDANKNILFLIGGIGSLEIKLQKIAGSLGLNDYVKFLGYISDREKIAYYQSSNCFILPTEELEGFGIVTIEALSCNLPVIATNAGATPEILNRINPELIARGINSSAIAEKIVYFITNSQNYHRENKFSEYAKENYNWELISRKLLNEYTIAANEKNM
jgi:glycosyltransferase involved in cell wall biosynthesis